MHEWVRKLLHVDDTPEALARGLAVGCFFGISFFWGLQILLAVVFAHFLKGNKIIAAAMTAISNPFTTLPLYTFCYFIGHLIVGGADDPLPDFMAVHSIESFLALGPHFFITMLTGTTVVGLVASVILYFSSEKLLEWLKAWHHKRAKHHSRSE